MSAEVKRCSRCGRRMRNSIADWAFVAYIDRDDVASVAEAICPDCTTAEEAAETAVNDALMQSERTIDGRLRVWPRLPPKPNISPHERN